MKNSWHWNFDGQKIFLQLKIRGMWANDFEYIDLFIHHSAAGFNHRVHLDHVFYI